MFWKLKSVSASLNVFSVMRGLQEERLSQSLAVLVCVDLGSSSQSTGDTTLALEGTKPARTQKPTSLPKL
jgi:hypothetical protein